MESKISVVINTLNEQQSIARVLESVKWADEIIVCDMHSTDQTVAVAKRMGAKVFLIKKAPFVELARNVSIAKATNEWVMVLDPDEEVPKTLATRLQEAANNGGVTTFVEIPRKNIIFNKWVKASMWWPDYNIRFFKKGQVKWTNKIHIKPETLGEGLKLEPEERFAITHHHYTSLDQFLTRLNRYTTIQAKELKESGYKFKWQDLITKSLSEFLGRYFANKGFEDGLHGLALSLLQAFSFLIVYLKAWELEKFPEQAVELKELKNETKKVGFELDHWFKYSNLSSHPLKRFLQKAKNRVT